MEKKEKPTFPKGFFTKSRPTITTKEALKEIIPFKWSKDAIEGRKKAILVSTKNGKVL